jgi:uncharacterized protein (TIGR03435 family)
MLGIATASAQTPAKKPAFEVTSVKAAKTSAGDRPVLRMQANGGRLIANYVTVKMLLQRAYATDDTGLFPNQMLGGPAWIESDRFDVEGRVDGDGRTISQQQTWLMVQSLLEDRFRLKTHHEMRELPVYNLVVGKNGPKLTRSEDQTPPNLETPVGPTSFNDPRKPMPRGTFSASGVEVTTMAGNAVPLSRMSSTLQRWVQRPVLDRTNLTGLFDFKVSFETPCGIIFACGSVDSAPLAPSLSSALDQLGLRLESAKTPGDILVIDSVSKPTEN